MWPLQHSVALLSGQLRDVDGLGARLPQNRFVCRPATSTRGTPDTNVPCPSSARRFRLANSASATHRQRYCRSGSTQVPRAGGAEGTGGPAGGPGLGGAAGAGDGAALAGPDRESPRPLCNGGRGGGVGVQAWRRGVGGQDFRQTPCGGRDLRPHPPGEGRQSNSQTQKSTKKIQF